MTTSVIVAGARTPVGKLMGSLKDFAATDLGAIAIKGALEKAKVPASAVEYVIMGQVLTAGAGQMPARQSAVAAGIPWDVPALSINKMCLSGIDSIALDDQLIRAGEFAVVVAGGSYAAYAWTRQQYYIGSLEGQVTVFRGVDQNLGPISLSSPDEETDIPVADLPDSYQRSLEDGIGVSGRTEAGERVDDLRLQATACRIARENGRECRTVPDTWTPPTPTPSPSGSRSPSRSPLPTTSPTSSGFPSALRAPDAAPDRLAVS